MTMLIKLALAILIVWLLLKHADIKKEHFANLNLWFLLPAFAAVLLQNLLTGVRWWALMRSVGIKTSVWAAVSLTMQGLFYTLFIPGGTVSGDVVKAALIAGNTGHGHKFDAAFSVLIDRICGLCGLFVLSWSAALLALLLDWQYSSAFRDFMLVIVIASPLFLLCAWAGFRCDLLLKIPLLRRLYDFSNRLSKGAIGRIEEAMSAYRPAGKIVTGWILISGLIAFPLIALAVWFIAAAALGWQDASQVDSIIGSLLSGSIGELAGILPLTPGGIGVRDAAFLEIFKACGLPSASAAVIPIVFTTLFVLASSTGAIFALYMLLAGKNHPGKK